MQGVVVSHLVIDEAHLISTWGESFRPDYLQIPKAHKQLGSPPIAAYTATATVVTLEDIFNRLEIQGCKLFQGEIDRPEIELSVEKYAWYEDKLKALISALEDAQEAGTPTIVYSSRISTLLELETALSEHDIKVGVYHGRMDASYRQVIERDFIAGRCTILLATKAFGMGVDKENVRNIIHFDPPDSLEAYWQEVGRAGRDGRRSNARLFFTAADFRRLDKVLYNSIPDINLISKVYDWLWNPMSDAQKQGFLPTRYFNSKKFLEAICGDDEVFEQKVKTSIAILEEFNIISRSYGKVSFLKTKPEIEESGLSFNSDLLSTRRQRQQIQLRIMQYFVESSDLRQVVLDHFRSNSIASKVKDMGSFGAETVNQEQAKELVFSVLGRSCSVRQLQNDLSSEEPQFTTVKAREYFGRLLDYELTLVIDSAESSGFLTKRQIGNKIYLLPTAKGKELLSTEEREELQTRNLKQLLLRMQGADEKIILKDMISSWFHDEAESMSSKEDWKYLVRVFRKEEFTFGNKKITGLKLAAAFLNKSKKQCEDSEVSHSICTDFLNYLFDGVVNEDPAVFRRWAEASRGDSLPG